MLPETCLSPYGKRSAEPSPVSRMMAAFAADFRDGIDINLGVGYISESTVPKARFAEAFNDVLTHPERHRAAFNYGGPRGSANLLQAVKGFLMRHHGVPSASFARNRLMIGASGASSILEGLAHVLPRGLVVTADPMYYIYCNFLQRMGFDLLTVPEDDEGIDVDSLTQKLESLGAADRARVQFFYVVTVNNPSCRVLSNRRRDRLVEAVAAFSRRAGRKIPLILDCAYETLVHGPGMEQPRSALPADDLGLVYEVSSLSKILAPAIRIGTMIGPDTPLFRAMVQRTSDVGFSAPMLAQEMAAVMLERYVDEQVNKVKRMYRRKAEEVEVALNTQLGDAVENYTGGHAGFYYYVTLRDLETTEDSPFFRYLTRSTGDARIDAPRGETGTRVIVIPGQYFVHPRGDLAEAGKRQFRLSYGFEEISRIESALAVIGDAITAQGAGER